MHRGKINVMSINQVNDNPISITEAWLQAMDSYTCICSNVDKNGGAYRNIKNKNTKGKLNFHITAKRVEVNIN